MKIKEDYNREDSSSTFEYHRLPNRVTSAPAVFQNIVEQVSSGIGEFENYLDDITIQVRLYEVTYFVLKILKPNCMKFTMQKYQCSYKR